MYSIRTERWTGSYVNRNSFRVAYATGDLINLLSFLESGIKMRLCSNSREIN
jgi:hypothetical protein